MAAEEGEAGAVFVSGTITPGPRVAAVHTRHVLYRDGVPLSEEETAAELAEARIARAG